MLVWRSPCGTLPCGDGDQSARGGPAIAEYRNESSQRSRMMVVWHEAYYERDIAVLGLALPRINVRERL